MKKAVNSVTKFQLTAARRRLAAVRLRSIGKPARFNSQPPEGGWAFARAAASKQSGVSTHSRPKAAGQRCVIAPLLVSRFNSQPPEGGWLLNHGVAVVGGAFQLTAARRRLG